MQRDPSGLRFAELADRLRRDGRISDATAICARGLARSPGYATGHVVMGEIFRDAGLPEKAAREWREALRLDGGHPRAYVCLGELHLDRGDVKQAAAAFEAALRYSPDLPEARARLAEAQDAGGKRQGDREGIGCGANAGESGEEPRSVTSDRFEELIAAVSDCSSFEAAAVVNAEGLLLEGSLPVLGKAEGGAGAAAELMVGARDLARRLAAGRLRAALIKGEGGGLRCMALGDVILAGGLKAEALEEAAGEQMEAAVADAMRLDGSECDVRS